VDIRKEAAPDILADGRSLPFADGTVAAVLIDPPYTQQYARDLYGIEYPRPLHLLQEAARVVKPCGRIGFVHYIVPMPPDGCKLIKVFGLSTSPGLSIRAVTIWEKEQLGLFQ
jgi:SAM-dependent methyltransferase